MSESGEPRLRPTLRNGNGQLDNVSLIFAVWGSCSALGSLLLITSFIVKRQLRTPTLLRVLYMSLSDAMFSLVVLRRCSMFCLPVLILSVLLCRSLFLLDSLE
jgi:hypothetical protein